MAGEAWKDLVSEMLPETLTDGQCLQALLYGMGKDPAMARYRTQLDAYKAKLQQPRWQVVTSPGWWQRKHAETLATHSAAVQQQKVDLHAAQCRLPPGSPASPRLQKQAKRSWRGGTGGSGNESAS